MQDYNIPLSLLILSVYIWTVLVLWNIFSNGHVTVTSCLFLQYDPSTNQKNRVHLLWKAEKVLMCSSKCQFLGGLSLHLNHLIGSRMTNYDWPFGTLPFGLFGSNLDTTDLETYPRTYSGHFWNMSIFDDSRAVWVLFRKWVVSENQSFLDEGAIVTPLIGLVLGGEVPRLNHGPISFPIENT